MRFHGKLWTAGSEGCVQVGYVEGDSNGILGGIIWTCHEQPLFHFGSKRRSNSRLKWYGRKSEFWYFNGIEPNSWCEVLNRYKSTEHFFWTIESNSESCISCSFWLQEFCHVNIVGYRIMNFIMNVWRLCDISAKQVRQSAGKSVIQVED